MPSRALRGGTLTIALTCAAVVVCCGEFGESTVPVPVAGEAGAGTDATAGGDGAADAAVVCPSTTDLVNDPKHCGRCGHDCLGGPCRAGICRSVVIADTTPGPWYIAADDAADGEVYWTSYKSSNVPGGDGAVRHVAKKGGTAAPLVENLSAYDVAVHGGLVVFSTTGSDVMSVPKAGGTATTFFSGRGMELTRRGTSLFFTGADAVGAGVFEAAPGVDVIRRASFAGSYVAEGIGVDDNQIIWANHNGSDGTPDSASVGRVQRDGQNASVEWAPMEKGVRRVTVAGTYAYWTSDYTSTIRRRLLSGGAVEPFFSGDLRYGTVVVDLPAGHAYITVELENKVVRRGLAAGAPEVELETGLEAPVGLAQDATAIYFTERVGGRIRRLAK
jgi:hypothetical protein